MNTTQTSLLYEFLLNHGQILDLDELYVEFNSHPDFPSFQSITDTLESFNISCLAASLPKERFDQLDQAVLVNLLIQGKNHLAIVEKEGKDQVRISQGSKSVNELGEDMAMQSAQGVYNSCDGFSWPNGDQVTGYCRESRPTGIGGCSIVQ